MSNTDLKQYLPICYKGIVEVEAEQDALSLEINRYNNICQTAMNDQFIQNCSLQAISYYENIYHIVADPENETLQFRRDRVLNRMKSLRPPYTYWYLRALLDTFFGFGRYTLDVDNNNYIITLESSAQDSQWYHEIQVNLTLIKPCNMIFINKPQVIDVLLMNETVKSSSYERNYKLDGTWLLGELPFASLTNERTEKMPNISSIKQSLISLNLQYLESIFNNVLLNNSVLVTELNLSIDGDKLIIEYGVDPTMTQNITDIKLRDSEDITLINSQVFIPIEDYVIIKHILKVEEGVND